MNPKTDRRPAETNNALRAHINSANSPSGFCETSTILTLRGAILIADLVVGDKIITRDTGMARLQAVTPLPRSTPYITFQKDALGASRPDKDIRVSVGSQVYCRSLQPKALTSHPCSIAADDLVNGTSIRAQKSAKDLTFVALTFDAPHIVYVDGVELRTQPMP